MPSWVNKGTVTFNPGDGEVTVCPVTPTTLYQGCVVAVRQLSPVGGPRLSFGLLRYKSSHWWVTGAIRVWGHHEWELYHVHPTMSLGGEAGHLLFEPRAVNLRWIEAGFPWTLEFLAVE